MKKNILFVLLIIVSIFTLVGCGSSKKSVTLSVSLNGTVHISSVKEGSTLEYELLGDKYKFEIVEITDSEVKITVDQYGLTNTDSLLSNDKDFVIEKGKKLELHTQTTDTQDTIVFSYNK